MDLVCREFGFSSILAAWCPVGRGLGACSGVEPWSRVQHAQAPAASAFLTADGQNPA